MAKEFLYFLTNAAGQSYRINENNIVIAGNDPVPQKNAPAGWEDKMVQFARNLKYHGLFRSFTIPLRFVKKGAKILRTIQAEQGFESVCYLIILKLDPATMRHRSWYKGEIDLFKARDMRDFFEVNVLEGGTRKLLAANEGKTYEFPLDYTAEVLELDGIILKNGVSYIIQPGEAVNYLSSLLGCIFISSEGVYRDISFGSPTSQTKAGGGDLSADSTDYLIRNDGSTYTFDIRAQYSVTAERDTIYNVGYVLSDGTNFIGPRVPVFLSGGIEGGELLPVEFEFTVTLEKGQRLFMDVIGGGGVLPNPLVYSEGGTMEIKFDYRMPTTRHRGFTAERMGQLLGTKVTDGAASLTAPVLAASGEGTEGNPARSLIIISGDGIRRLPGAVVKTKFSDFFKAMDVAKFIGLDIVGEQIELRPRLEYFSGPVAYDFGVVKNCEGSWSEDHAYNLLKIGSPDQEFDDVNGRSEVNTIQEWGLPITRVVKEFDRISPYRHDCYGVEYTRINMEGKATTDSSSDNDVFVIDCEGIKDETGLMIWRPYRRVYASMTGVITDTIFNVELSPKRLLLQLLPEISGLFYKMTGKEVTFQKSEKNAELSTLRVTLGGDEIITEKANVPAVYNGSMFLPYVLEIVTKVPVNFLQIMDAARAGKFSFTWLGQKWTGFLLEGGIKPATMEEQTIKLLAAPENDLKKLIR